jgi:2-phosphosulfolactate phosphatase
MGAGAIIRHLTGSLSPEVQMAAAAFHALQPQLKARLQQCSSGKELIERGYSQDVELAADLDASLCAPLFKDGAYRPMD